MLSLVIFDAIWVVYRRTCILRKNPLKGDYTHLHYRLLALGWKRGEVRVFVWMYAVLMGLIMLSQNTQRVWKVAIFAFVFVVFFGLHYYLYQVKKLPSAYEVKKKK